MSFIELDNISLKEQLILSEVQFLGNPYYYIEDGLSFLSQELGTSL